jgi:hypothetical protein
MAADAGSPGEYSQSVQGKEPLHLSVRNFSTFPDATGGLDRLQKALFEPIHRKTLDNCLSGLPAHPRRQISILQQHSGVFAQFIGIIAEKTAYAVFDRLSLVSMPKSGIPG